MRIFLLALAISIIGNAAQAEMTSLTCTYTKSVSLVEKEVITDSNVKDFVLKFMIDFKTKEFNLVGNDGPNPVLFINNNAGFTFLEKTTNGNVTTTTVSFDGNSVHSKNNLFIIGDKITFLPSQYYGTCGGL